MSGPRSANLNPIIFKFTDYKFKTEIIIYILGW